MSSPPRPPPPRPPPPGPPGRLSPAVLSPPPSSPPPPRSPPPPPSGISSPPTFAPSPPPPLPPSSPQQISGSSDTGFRSAPTPPPPRAPPTPPPPKAPSPLPPFLHAQSPPLAEPSKEEKESIPSPLPPQARASEPLQAPPDHAESATDLPTSPTPPPPAAETGVPEGKQGESDGGGKMASEQAQAYLLSLKRTLSPSSVEEKRDAAIETQENDAEVTDNNQIQEDDRENEEEEMNMFEGGSSRVPFTPPPPTPTNATPINTNTNSASSDDTNANTSANANTTSRTFSAQSGEEGGAERDDESNHVTPLTDLVTPHLRAVHTHIHKQLASITETIAAMDRDGATKFMCAYKDSYNTAYLHQLHHTYMMLLGGAAGAGASSGAGNANASSASHNINTAVAVSVDAAGDGVGVGARLFSAQSDEPADTQTQTNKFYIDNPIPNFKAHTHTQAISSSSSAPSSVTPYTLLDSQEHVEKFSMGDVKEMLGSLFVCTNKALTHTIAHPHIQTHFNVHKNYMYTHIKNLYAQKLVSVENALDKYCYYAQERLVFSQRVHDEMVCKQLDSCLSRLQKEVQSLYGNAVYKLDSLRTVYEASYRTTVENYIHNLDMVFQDTHTHTELQGNVYKSIFAHVREEMGRCKNHYAAKGEKGWGEVRSELANLDEKYMKLYELVYTTFVGGASHASSSPLSFLPSRGQLAGSPSSPPALQTPLVSLDAYTKAFYKYKQHQTNIHTRACATLYGEMESMYVGFVEELCGKVCMYRMMVYDMEVYHKQLSLYLDYLYKKNAHAQRKKKEFSLQNMAAKTSSMPAVSKLGTQTPAAAQKQPKQLPSPKYSSPPPPSKIITDVNTQEMNTSLEELMHYANFTYPAEFTHAYQSSSASSAPILRMGRKLKVACELAGCSAEETLEIMLELYASTKTK